ncbi:hypothetical protein N474_22125 [Pseudoalteromonas luteoviolacea CPMOR-2]|uniref:LysR family transcriptional regulator n=1 Tax=Pseudoalteromonas luteoviolacea TaxID=43657 RepID=UPI0007B06BAD|nr:LysR family transcriptional regulator [Pseudoalteromonas luteoviolacea]KZN53096.1 hypothetical protein N474_22125 [Pseudoalteromonas luteoviolacea CPMOR-2]
MEFYHLKSFVTVAKTQNLTKAAKQLYTTPPAVSAHIKALEQELDVILFERSSKGMRLTAQGVALQEKAEATLNSANEFLACATHLDLPQTGKLTIGINLSARVLRCDELLKQMHSANSLVSLELSPSSSSEILNHIDTGLLDGGYVFGLSGEEFESVFIANRKITTVLPKAWSDEQSDELSLLMQKPWISVGNNCPFDIALHERLPMAKISHISSFDELTRLDLVARNHGVSFVDESEVENLPEGVNRTQLLDFELPLYFVVSKNRLNEPLIKGLLSEVEKLY